LGSATGSGTSARWQLTLAGSVVLALFLSAGLTVWALILAPSGPRPGPGGPAPSPAAAGPGIAAAERPEAHPHAELPAEVKTFLADLSAKAKAKPDDVETWLKLAQVNARASQLDPTYQSEAISAFEHVLRLDPENVDALRGVANVHYDRDDHAKAIPA